MKRVSIFLIALLIFFSNANVALVAAQENRRDLCIIATELLFGLLTENLGAFGPNGVPYDIGISAQYGKTGLTWASLSALVKPLPGVVEFYVSVDSSWCGATRDEPENWAWVANLFEPLGAYVYYDKEEGGIIVVSEVPAIAPLLLVGPFEECFHWPVHGCIGAAEDLRINIAIQGRDAPYHHISFILAPGSKG